LIRKRSTISHAFRRREKVDILKVDLGILVVSQGRLFHLAPGAVGLETLLEHPLRLFLASRDEADHVLTESGLQGVGFDVGMETGSVFRLDQVLDFLSHGITSISQPAWIYLAAVSV